MVIVKRGKRMAVPWYSMQEWNLVYELLFSDDHGEQGKGLDRLVGWKTRCPTLPAAIESTLIIFQVLREDPDSSFTSGKCSSVAREYQLRLMYSTAVMRFLNLMLFDTSIEKDSDEVMSMYNKAAKVNIPQWIVSLRHDAAHGTALPDLGLLQMAAVFIKKWLQENYWQEESSRYKDWYVTKEDVLTLSPDEEELATVLGTWEALNMYKVAGFKMIAEIPDKDLRDTVNLIRDSLNFDEQEMQWIPQEKENPTLSKSLTFVLRKLELIVTGLSNNAASLVAQLLVAGNFFLPAENLFRNLVPNAMKTDSPLEHLPIVLVQCCDHLMYTLWNLDVIPELASELISVSSNPNECDLRRNLAALWAQKIFLSCLKVQEAAKVLERINSDVDDLVIIEHYKHEPRKTRKVLAIAAVEKIRPDLKSGFRWNLHKVPQTLRSVEFVQQSITMPSKFTLIYLSSLLDLASSRISSPTRKLILELVEMFSSNSEDLADNNGGKIFSVEDVEKIPHPRNEEADGPSPTLGFETRFSPQSHWAIAQGDFEWEKVPLGVLPWQREETKEEELGTTKMPGFWTQLFAPCGWAEEDASMSMSFSGNTVDEGKHEMEVPLSLRKVKAGRVDKPYLKSTPVKNSKTLFKHRSPSMKASDFIAGV